jgi:hypothetical protein
LTKTRTPQSIVFRGFGGESVVVLLPIEGESAGMTGKKGSHTQDIYQTLQKRYEKALILTHNLAHVHFWGWMSLARGGGNLTCHERLPLNKEVE